MEAHWIDLYIVESERWTFCPKSYVLSRNCGIRSTPLIRVFDCFLSNRRDVLVYPEHVTRIVFRLQFDQLLVDLGPVTGANQRFSLLTKTGEIQVQPAIRELMQFRPDLPGPRNILLGLLDIRPGRIDAH